MCSTRLSPRVARVPASRNFQSAIRTPESASRIVHLLQGDDSEGAHTPHVRSEDPRSAMAGTAACTAAVAPAARCPRLPRARARSEPGRNRRRADVSTRSFGDDGEVVVAFPTGARNPPVTGGPIIRPRGRPARSGVSDAGDDGASAGDPERTRDADASIARRTSLWNQWFVDAVAGKNLHAIDLLFDMPWASTDIIISSMRMMHDPVVFERVCEMLIRRRAGNELETKERVGGLTAVGWAAKKGNASALVALLDAGADANAVDASGATALMHAVVGDSVVAAEVLTKRGAWVDGRARQKTAPSSATTESSSSRFDETKKTKPRLDARGWTPLTWAARRGGRTWWRFFWRRTRTRTSRAVALDPRPR